MSARKIDPTEMRRRVIDATVECLVSYGYAGTTTQRVQDRAGVSRGALLHHFPSKADMFVAAVQHVARRQEAEIRAAAAQDPPLSDQLDFAISVLRRAMSGTLYLAGYELWMAARTDDTLRSVLAPYERDVGRDLRELGAAVFGLEHANRPGFPVAFESLIQLLRGMALTSVLRDSRAMDNRVLAAWRDTFLALCAAAEDIDPPRAQG